MIALYAFNDDAGASRGRSRASRSSGSARRSTTRASRDAFWLSVKAALGATAIALVLGTLASLAVSRYRFFGRETISFLVILPIALPGIVTGMALNATFRTVLEPFGIELGLFTIIVGHATFCIVVVYNNVIARLRRTARSLEEASADLGADSWQTFRYVTLPQLRTALLAGALLAFALSFDEMIVTTFTAGARADAADLDPHATSRGRTSCRSSTSSRSFVILLSIIPVYFAQRLTREEPARASAAGRAARPGREPSERIGCKSDKGGHVEHHDHETPELRRRRVDRRRRRARRWRC